MKKHFTCEHPADGCEEPCPNTTKGWAANMCWTSSVPLVATSATILGTVGGRDVSSMEYTPFPGAPLPKIGDIIIDQDGNQQTVSNIIPISGGMYNLTWVFFDEDDPFDPEEGQIFYLLVVTVLKQRKTKGCVTATSTVSKQDAQDKALDAAKRLAAKRMEYLIANS